MADTNNVGQAFLAVAGRIGIVELEIDQGFQDGYHNNFVIPGEYKQRASNPKGQQWVGGKFKPVSVVINLAVGVQSVIVTPQDLEDIVTFFFKLALPDDLSGIKDPITLYIGTWFQRIGYIEDVGVAWQEPYDVDTGQAMRARLSFDFIADFYNKETNLTLDRNPKSSDWTFQFVGRRRSGPDVTTGGV